MCMRTCVVLMVQWACGLLPAQYWAPAELPVVVNNQLYQFYWDEEEGTFCMVGRTIVCEGEPGAPFCAGILRHRNGQWDTLGYLQAGAGSVAQWADTLFVAGTQGVNGTFLPGKATAWYDGMWHTDPQLNHSSHHINLRKRNGNIYALGRFEIEPGIAHYGVGIRQGGRWVPIGNLPQPSSTSAGPDIFDIIEYNGQLVITGNINTSIGDDVFVLEGDDWVPLGGGLVGWNSYGKRLAVYQGDLYVAGGIFMSQGDAGQNIMRWDGQQWHPLGTGLQTQLGSFGQTGGVEDMMVHEGELWVSGGFRYAGGVYARGMARWDGSQWCSVGGEPSGIVFCFGFFQDTLYINNPGPIDGQDMDYVAKFVGPEYENNCGLWTDVEEEPAPEPALRAWLQDGMVVLEGLPVGAHHVQIVDATGRLVQQERVLSESGRTHLLPTVLQEGIYLINVAQVGMTTKLHIAR